MRAALVTVTLLAACGAPTPTAPDAAAACPPPPATVTLPWQTTATRATVHWALAAGCVAVTYDDTLGAYRGPLEAAVATMNGIACSRLCFRTPTARADAPDRASATDRRVHLRATPDADASASAITFESDTGRIRNASFAVPMVSLADDARAALVRVLMLSAGMRASSGSTPSALAVTPSIRAASPTEADRAALCGVYGSPSLCGD